MSREKRVVKVKILLLTPISVDAIDPVAEARVAELNLPPGVDVVCQSLREGPESVETMFDEAFSASALLMHIMEIPHFDYDAVVINCFADPGVDGLREILDVPIVGAGSAALHFAAMIAETFSIVSVGKNSVPHARRRLAGAGLSSRVASVYGVEIPVLKLHDSKQATVEAISRSARKAVEFDGADAIVLGCTGMADVASMVEKEVGVPVIEPTGVAVWTAVAMRSLGIAHGRSWMYLPADPTKLRRR